MYHCPLFVEIPSFWGGNFFHILTYFTYSVSCFFTLCSLQNGCVDANSFIFRTVSSSGGAGTGIRLTIPVFCRRDLELYDVVIESSDEIDGQETRVFVFMC